MYLQHLISFCQFYSSLRLKRPQMCPTHDQDKISKFTLYFERYWDKNQTNFHLLAKLNKTLSLLLAWTWKRSRFKKIYVIIKYHGIWIQLMTIHVVLVFIFMVQTYVTTCTITRLFLKNDMKWKLGWTLPFQESKILCKFTYVMRMITNIEYTYGRRVIQRVNKVCDKVCALLSLKYWSRSR